MTLSKNLEILKLKLKLNSNDFEVINWRKEMKKQFPPDAAIVTAGARFSRTVGQVLLLFTVSVPASGWRVRKRLQTGPNLIRAAP